MLGNRRLPQSKYALAIIALALLLFGCSQSDQPNAASTQEHSEPAAELATAQPDSATSSPTSEPTPTDRIDAQVTALDPPVLRFAELEAAPPQALPFTDELTVTSTTSTTSTSTTSTTTVQSEPSNSSTTSTTRDKTLNPTETVNPTAADTNPASATPTTPGLYSIAQVIDGTISAGDGSNPNEEAPMGRHETPLSLNQGWNWATGPTRNSVWGELGTGESQYAEFRCAVLPESGHTPTVPFRVNIRHGAYYQFANNSWQKAFDTDLTGGNHGGYLGTAGEINSNPFNSGSHGLIEWRREPDGSFSAPWNADAHMMHFWAAQRQEPAPGQTAEFLTSEFRIQQPDDQTVDLSQVKVLFQCGVDYYAVTTGQGTQVPGPGIGKYYRLSAEWRPSLWVTLPKDVPAASISDFRTWLEANTPPNVTR